MNTEKPKNYIAECLLITIFCCMPAGLYGIYLALRSDIAWEAGKEEEARSYGLRARQMCIFAAVASIAAVFLGIVIYLILQNTSDKPTFA